MSSFASGSKHHNARRANKSRRKTKSAPVSEFEESEFEESYCGPGLHLPKAYRFESPPWILDEADQSRIDAFLNELDAYAAPAADISEEPINEVIHAAISSAIHHTIKSDLISTAIQEAVATAINDAMNAKIQEAIHDAVIKVTCHAGALLAVRQDFNRNSAFSDPAETFKSASEDGTYGGDWTDEDWRNLSHTFGNARSATPVAQDERLDDEPDEAMTSFIAKKATAASMQPMQENMLKMETQPQVRWKNKGFKLPSPEKLPRGHKDSHHLEALRQSNPVRFNKPCQTRRPFKSEEHLANLAASRPLDDRDLPGGEKAQCESPYLQAATRSLSSSAASTPLSSPKFQPECDSPYQFATLSDKMFDALTEFELGGSDVPIQEPVSPRARPMKSLFALRTAAIDEEEELEEVCLPEKQRRGKKKKGHGSGRPMRQHKTRGQALPQDIPA